MRACVCSPPGPACRYGTYKLVQAMKGGEMLTGFTRILHRMTDDNLMDEVRATAVGKGRGAEVSVHASQERCAAQAGG